MDTYFKIMQTVGKTEKVILPKLNFRKAEFDETSKFWSHVRDTNKSTPIDTYLYMYIQRVSSSDHELSLDVMIKNKHYEMFKIVNAKIFVPLNNQLLEILHITQKVYNGFALLAKIWKYNKNKIMIEHDLLLNKITEHDRNVIKINQGGSNYLFTSKDMINHIETQLSNAQNFFADPLLIKNPYNNVEFTKANLYNIYYKLKKTDYKFPILFHNYFLCDFDLERFKIENEYLIRDIHIKNIVFKSEKNWLFRSMKKMIQNSLDNSLKISKEVTKDSFISIMRPYYYLYLNAYYAVEGTEKRRKCFIIFNRKINELYEYNPKFGRTYLKKLGLNKNYSVISDLDHPTFTMKEALKYNSAFVDEIDSPSPSISDEDYPETEENTSSNTSSNSRLYNLLRQYAQVIPEEGEITLSDDEMSFSDNTN